MPISEDLRSVQKMVSSLDNANQALINLVSQNLAALADQVEALEDLPLVMQPCDHTIEHHLALTNLQAPIQ